jgi:hypothetical protein
MRKKNDIQIIRTHIHTHKHTQTHTHETLHYHKKKQIKNVPMYQTHDYCPYQ